MSAQTTAEAQVANADPQSTHQDFGDAPDPTYPSLLASNGARHNDIAPARFGPSVDGEPDSRQVDNETTTDDGLLDTNPVRIGITNVSFSTGPLFLNVLVDFNSDGDWADPGERIVADQPIGLPPGQNTTTKLMGFNLPGNTWMRMTLTGAAIGASYDGTGEFAIGETEDHISFGGEHDPFFSQNHDPDTSNVHDGSLSNLHLATSSQNEFHDAQESTGHEAFASQNHQATSSSVHDGFQSNVHGATSSASEFHDTAESTGHEAFASQNHQATSSSVHDGFQSNVHSATSSADEFHDAAESTGHDAFASQNHQATSSSVHDGFQSNVHGATSSADEFHDAAESTGHDAFASQNHDPDTSDVHDGFESKIHSSSIYFGRVPRRGRVHGARRLRIPEPRPRYVRRARRLRVIRAQLIAVRQRVPRCR